MTDEEFRAVWMAMDKRLTELFLSVCAIQSLLQQAGLFSKAVVDERIGEMQKRYAESLSVLLREQQDQEAHERILQLLESFEGPKQ